MPLAVDNITKDSSKQSVRDAIQRTIKYLIDNEGKSPKEAAGQAYAMAEKKWGKAIGKEI